MNHALDTMRQRLAPDVTDRNLMRQYLLAADINLDRAVRWWQADRAHILAGGNSQDVSSSSDSEGDVDEEGDDQLQGSTGEGKFQRCAYLTYGH